ncbi:MAG: response regulator [Rhizomicrobium sp.]
MKHCLVVDDSRVVRRIARRFLENLQFSITEAEDGRMALDECRRRMPDAILLDRNMPNMNGVEFVRALRVEAGGDKPIVIFCTTENEMAFMVEAIESGANEYIMKPFDETVIVDKFTQVGLLER